MRYRRKGLITKGDETLRIAVQRASKVGGEILFIGNGRRSALIKERGETSRSTWLGGGGIAMEAPNINP